MQRFMALMIMVIPAIIAAFGIKLMRDIFFGIKASFLPSLTVQFFVGFLLFVLGLWFIGGFIFYRDRKRNKVQDRFKVKK